MSDTQNIAALLGNLTITQVVELRKMLESQWGVSGDPVAIQPAQVFNKFSPAPVEEPTEVAVWLLSAGDKKINVIKVVREVTTLGLKEAKDLVDGAPKVVKEGLGKEDAAGISQRLTLAGATTEVK